MQPKDHYRTLGISASATVAEIKKAYRALAFKYHPDTNVNNAFAEAHFREVQEAYSVLSDVHSRRKYDGECWLSGMSNRMQHRQAITPEWILKESNKLKKHISDIDTYRMSHAALQEYVLIILSDSHLAVLKNEGDEAIRATIINVLLHATERLELRYSHSVAARMLLLAEGAEESIRQIHSQLQEKEKKEQKRKGLPLVIILVTLALCVLMYLYGRR
ncbi:MAG: J domain-containing protein [Taibaiella sp.]|nr:J domain-containing protein [Taibaiella sp.]